MRGEMEGYLSDSVGPCQSPQSCFWRGVSGTQGIEKRRDAPYGDEPLLRCLGVLIVDAYRVVHSSASDRLHRGAPELVHALAEEVHLVHRAVRRAREEQALCRVPHKASDGVGEVEGRQ